MDLSTLKQHRGVVKASLTKALTFITTIDRSTVTTAALKARRSMVDNHFQKFEGYQDQIEELTKDATELDEQIEARFEIENKYIEIVSLIDEIITEINPDPPKFQSSSSSSSSQPPQINVRLPTLDLPTFDGRYEEWISFHDLFVASVDSHPSLSKAYKLTYLKSATSKSEEATRLIGSLKIEDDNYDLAWKMLEDRFNNQREIVTSLLKRLFSQQSIQHESASELRRMIDTTKEVLRTLSVLKRPVDTWDDFIVFYLVERMDSESRKQWAMKLHDTNLPTLSDLYSFVDQHIRGLEASQSKVTIADKQPHKFFHHQKQPRVHFTKPHNGDKCGICRQSHPIFQCSTFMNATLQERNNLAKKGSLCFNCLKSDHRVHECKSKFSCKTCGGRHHTLIHHQSSAQHGPSSSSNRQQSSHSQNHPHVTGTSSQQTMGSYHGKHLTDMSQVLLSTALANVHTSQGTVHTVRLLLDTGSEATFISESCATSLGLRRKHCSIAINGISSSSAGVTKGEVELSLFSNINSSSLQINALILPKVTGKIPSEVCEKRVWPHLQGLTLADPDFYNPGRIDILLGAEYVPLIMREGRKFGGDHSPVAEKTMFGWVVSGRVQTHHSTIRTHHVICEVDPVLQKFWEVERIPEVTHLTEEEKLAEEHFTSTYQRGADGKFIVELPFNSNISKLGSSRDIALQRLKQIERRLSSKPNCAAKYSKFMDEYIALGHMELVNEAESGEEIGKTNYIPHHFVMKTHDSEAKFRVVFDGSAKTSTNISINNCLLVGPTIQDDIYSLLLRFRLPLIAIKADIGKMYRQFWVDKKSSDFQRILWRNNPCENVKEYRLKTVSYGTSSAPFLATRCLAQLAKDWGKTYPIACHSLGKNMYVDDMMTGANDVDSAIQLCADTQFVAEQAKLDLLKWASNSEAVMQSIPREKHESEELLSFDESSVKALGVQWHPRTDTFSFSVHPFVVSDQITKRALLSDIAKVFDPIGFLAPIIISAKILMQEVWKCELQWDDNVPNPIRENWKTYCEQLIDIKNIFIPRCITVPRAKKYELHGFGDASIKAYGAVIYLKTFLKGKVCQVRMITAKTKVAPVKQIALPRLELLAAVMTAQLLHAVKGSLSIEADMIAWTDSTIVLKWIAGHSSRWQTFIANRVAKIQELLPSEHWRHVPGSQNPADCASRGISPTELKDHQLWWSGPEWLHQCEIPSFQTSPIPNEVDLEEKKRSILVNVALSQPQQQFMNNLLRSYSSLNKLKRVTAFVLRFISNCKVKKREWNKSPLSPAELDSAILVWVKFVQKCEFEKEISQLQSSANAVARGSKIHNLSPFIDAGGIIRVGGRLQNSNLQDRQKHQIILPTKCHLTKLIIIHFHLIYLHANFQLMWANIHLQYWIPRARDHIRHVIRKCVTCKRYRAETAQQFMGNLPEVRVVSSRPFLNTGIDYAGPFNLRLIKGRSNKLMKGYMAIFICMATKAVHIEPVSELSTEAFMSALECFVSRRGICHNIYSDRGTNFVGAGKELQLLFNSQQHNQVMSDKLAVRGINWKFNPASAPHQGGLWEAAVKSAKFHLKRVIGNESLTFEQFRTVLCKVEACERESTFQVATSTANHPAFLATLGKRISINSSKTVQVEYKKSQFTSGRSGTSERRQHATHEVENWTYHAGAPWM